jgi:hypothetical protein
MEHMSIFRIAYNLNVFIVIFIMWIWQGTHVSWVQAISHESKGRNLLFLKMIGTKYRLVA